MMICRAARCLIGSDRASASAAPRRIADTENRPHSRCATPLRRSGSSGTLYRAGSGGDLSVARGPPGRTYHLISTHLNPAVQSEDVLQRHLNRDAIKRHSARPISLRLADTKGDLRGSVVVVLALRKSTGCGTNDGRFRGLAHRVPRMPVQRKTLRVSDIVWCLRLEEWPYDEYQRTNYWFASEALERCSSRSACTQSSTSCPCSPPRCRYIS
jgi:hypothetical protein